MLFHPETGRLPRRGDDHLVAKGADPQRQDVVTSYAGKLPGAPISELLHLGDGWDP